MPAGALEWSSLQDQMVYPDCLLTKNGLKEAWGWLRDLSTMSNRCTGTYGPVRSPEERPNWSRWSGKSVDKHMYRVENLWIKT